MIGSTRWMCFTWMAVAVAATLACGDDGMEPMADCESGTDMVDASVAVGNQVVFDWSPACEVLLVLVEQEAGDVWGVETPGGGNGIAPPVTYGVVPAGAEEFQEPVLLVPGVTYELVLWRDVEGTQTLIAVEEFVR